MKKLVIASFMLIAFSAQGQMKEGKVVYEQTMQMGRIEDPEIAARLPKERKENFELIFGNNQSLWQVLPNTEGTDNSTVSGPGFVIRMAGNNDITYFDFIKGRRIDQREMFDREFIVEDTIMKLKWKLTGETKTILNYPVQKAVAERLGRRSIMSMENGEMKRQEVADTSYITAWFTTNIPVPVGPQEFQGQLPGLILELNINNGRIVYKAVEVSPKVNLASIKEPRGGKKMSSDEFNKERERLLEEMRKNNPGGNRVIRMN